MENKPMTSRRRLNAAFVLVGGLSFLAGACVAQNRFPDIDAAQASLASAIDALQHTPEMFNGHKLAAMNDIRAAQNELTAAVATYR